MIDDYILAGRDGYIRIIGQNKTNYEDAKL